MPVTGMHPNVLEVSFDIRLTKEDPLWLRPYIPNIGCGVRGRSSSDAAELIGDTHVSGLALIAIKPLNDGDEVSSSRPAFRHRPVELNSGQLRSVVTAQQMLCQTCLSVCHPSLIGRRL